jgi:hypothetical protein
MTRIVITQLEPHIHEVRLHRDGERHFFASFNVTERDGGRVIRTSSLNIRDGSPPPGVRWWLAFAARHFPRAEFAEHARMTPAGLRWRDPIPLKVARP